MMIARRPAGAFQLLIPEVTFLPKTGHNQETSRQLLMEN